MYPERLRAPFVGYWEIRLWSPVGAGCRRATQPWGFVALFLWITLGKGPRSFSASSSPDHRATTLDCRLHRAQLACPALQAVDARTQRQEPGGCRDETWNDRDRG